MQEFEALASEFQALGVRVRAITAQHGDIPNMLKDRKCVLSYVSLVSDPNFAICQDYVDKGLPLILAKMDAPMLMKIGTSDGRLHNMVQPGVVVEDAKGNWIYTWTWHDLDGKNKWNGTVHGPQVYQRPTTEAILEGIKTGSFSKVDTSRYPDKWPRKDFQFPAEISFLLRPPFQGEAAAKL